MKGYIIICLLLLSCGVAGQQTGELPAPIYADPYYCGSCDPEIVWNSATGEWLFFIQADVRLWEWLPRVAIR